MARKTGMGRSIGKVRGRMYRGARILGDIQALADGRVINRVGYRMTGKMTARGMGRVWR